MITSVTEPLVVYNRIAQNSRKTVLLVLVTLASIIPFVLLASFGAAESVTWRMGRETRITSANRRALQRQVAWSSSKMPDVEAQIAKLKAQEEQQEAANAALGWRFMIVVAAGITAVLGLLFWGLASAPTSSLLAMCGARPAGAAETEAKRVLEELANRAGLPVPKLYVIETSTPNAFAAGADPARSVVAVTRGLLSLLDQRELEAVLAHELSHIGNRDTRLNMVVASISLFLRLPYLLRRRNKMEDRQASEEFQERRRYGVRIWYSLALIPVYLYIFFVAPILAAFLRAAISRNREFQADGDAVLLSRNPEALLRALSKIGGAGTDIAGANPAIAHLYFADPSGPGGGFGIFTGSLLATHPPIERRITRLLEYSGNVPLSVIEKAVHAGKAYSRAHPTRELDMSSMIKQDELSMLTGGNPMGRVARTLAATPLYDRPDAKSCVLGQIKAGELIVVFDDPGRFRQVLRHDHTFGYIPYSVKLQKVDLMPSEIHDPAVRAAVEAGKPIAGREKKATADGRSSSAALSGSQIAAAAFFGLAVFAGMFLILMYAR